MAYRVVWSSKAVEDVEAIAAYISRDSPSYAAAVVQKIIETSRLLLKSPDKGKIVPEFSDPAIRERSAYTYRLIYRMEEEQVTVATVVHTLALLDFET